MRSAIGILTCLHTMFVTIEVIGILVLFFPPAFVTGYDFYCAEAAITPSSIEAETLQALMLKIC